MTVFPAPRAVPPRRALPAIGDGTRRDAPPSALEAVRPTPMDWARRRRAEREARRLEAAGNRALTRLDRLGPSWHIVDWPRTDLWQTGWSSEYGIENDERAGFLAIGPGGVFGVTVVDHGRTRVLLAGDVVQINGKRPPYVTEARRDAKRASKALSAAVGLRVPITPVLAFVGSGVISVHGLPKDCLVATHRELDRLLVAGGDRITASTARKLSAVASQPATWFRDAGSPADQRRTADYRWYGDERTATDKKPTGR